MSRDVPCQAIRPLPIPSRFNRVRHVTSRASGEGTLVSAIIHVREHVGSQAKLAAELGTTERTVKRWEKGSVPQPKWRAGLIQLGVDARLFESAANRAQVESRLRKLEAEIATIRKLLA